MRKVTDFKIGKKEVKPVVGKYYADTNSSVASDITIFSYVGQNDNGDEVFKMESINTRRYLPSDDGTYAFVNGDKMYPATLKK